jgi:hypothetical protein
MFPPIRGLLSGDYITREIPRRTKRTYPQVLDGLKLFERDFALLGDDRPVRRAQRPLRGHRVVVRREHAPARLHFWNRVRHGEIAFEARTRTKVESVGARSSGTRRCRSRAARVARDAESRRRSRSTPDSPRRVEVCAEEKSRFGDVDSSRVPSRNEADRRDVRALSSASRFLKILWLGSASRPTCRLATVG